MSDLEILLEE